MTDPRIRWQRRPRPRRTGIVIFTLLFAILVAANLIVAVALDDYDEIAMALAAPAAVQVPSTGTGQWPLAVSSSWPECDQSFFVETFGRRVETALAYPPESVTMTVRTTCWPLDVHRDVRLSGPRPPTDPMAGTLPLRSESKHILWAGLLLPPALSAGLVACLAVAPMALVRRVRIASCLCPMCKYPRGSSDTCSECGYAHPTPASKADDG